MEGEAMSTATSEQLTIPADKPNFLNLISRLALAVAVIALAALALLFFHFAVPVWDDLIASTGTRHKGLWQYVIGHIYNRWSGRWASCGLESATLPLLDITRYYWVLIGFVAVVNAIGAYVLCRWFTPTSSKKTTAAMAACLLALLWAGVPSLAQVVYWYVGATENAMPFALSAMLIVAVIKLSKSSRQLVPGIVLCCAAAIFICALHELYGSMLGAALAAGTLWAILTKGVNRSPWIAVTIAAAIGLVIVVKAPGNAVRIATDGGKHSRQLGYDLRIALSQVRHFVPRWLLNPKLLAACLWVAFSPVLRAQRRESTSNYLFHWLLPATWLVMLSVGFIAPSWGFGRAMPDRTLSGIYVIFVVGLLINVYVWSGKIAWSSEIIASLACLILAASLLLTGNTITAIGDLHTRVRPWHLAMEKRFATLRNEASIDALIPELPKPYPRLLLDGEVDKDPKDYRNWGTVVFFKLRSVRLIPRAGAIPPVPLQPTTQPGANG